MASSQNIDLQSAEMTEAAQSCFDFPLRALLYSHDSAGLGHLRRNLAIASEISSTFPNSSIMIVTGSPCATQFKLPANTDLIKIPTVSKDKRGRYATRFFSGNLQDTIQFRSQLILNTFQRFKPNIVIVDHQLTGLMGEALEMLREAKKTGVQTIYGCRDVKDSPEVIHKMWNTDEHRWALNEGYDRVCIYGMPEVFDPRIAYAPCFDKVKRLDFTGYIVPPVKTFVPDCIPRQRKKVLVTFGGGNDGALRAKRYLQALTIAQAPWDSHIITGPLMENSVKHRIKGQAAKLQPIGSIKIQRFNHNIPLLMQQVDAIVSMAGYNTCVEILQSSLPAVLLPRSFPRQEQLIRAKRMAELGWVNVITDADPNPRTLFNAVESALSLPRQTKPEVRLNGLSNLSKIILEQLQTAGLVENMTQLEQSNRKVM